MWNTTNYKGEPVTWYTKEEYMLSIDEINKLESENKKLREENQQLKEKIEKLKQSKRKNKNV